MSKPVPFMFLFVKKKFTSAKAAAWLKSHGHRAKVVAGKRFLKAALKPSSHFESKSFRIASVQDGVRVINARPK